MPDGAKTRGHLKIPDGAETRAETEISAPAQARTGTITLALPQISTIRLPQLLLGLILMAALVTRMGTPWTGPISLKQLDTPADQYFDEIYFAKTAQEILNGDPKAWEFYGHENTHPPLSKLFMAGGMLFFGEDAFGWRFFGALAGVGAVFFMYLLARKLFNSEVAGLAGALLLACDGLAFAQSRIATPDTYVLFFMLGCVYFLVSERFLFSGVFFGAAVACKWIAALTGIPIVLFLAWLLITRWRQVRSEEGTVKSFEITLPAALAALYAGIVLIIVGFLSRHPDQKPGLFDGLGLLDLAGWLLTVMAIVVIVGSLISLASERSAHGSFGFSPQGKVWLEIALIFGAFFILVPGFVYFMTYWPFLLNPPSTQAMGEHGFLGLGQVVRQNRLAYDFHSTLSAPHPYASTWDEWPIMARPVYFYAGSNNDRIYALGNPVVFWSALPALAFALWQGLAYVRARIDASGALSVAGRLPPGRAALLFVVVAYLGFWIPMGLTSRVVFIYHYLPALAFGILALAYAVDWLWHRPEPSGRKMAMSFLGLVVLTFAFFYPHLAAVPVSDWVDDLYYPFDNRFCEAFAGQGSGCDNPFANQLWDWE